MNAGLNQHIPRGFGMDVPRGTYSMFGTRIVAQPLAVEVTTEFRLACRNSRRKRWFVVRVETKRPGCWKVGNVLYMHPTLLEQLKQGATP